LNLFEKDINYDFSTDVFTYLQTSTLSHACNEGGVLG